MNDRSSVLQACLEQLKAGDLSARARLLQGTQERLRGLVYKMLKGFPGVRRWEEMEDVAQDAALKLWRALETVAPANVRAFLSLASVQVRRVLLDLARHYGGPHCLANKHLTPGSNGQAFEPADSSHDQRKLASWTAFHEQIAALPEQEREVFELLWYQGLNQGEAAEMLGVSVDTVKRRWQSARVLLYEALAGELPPI